MTFKRFISRHFGTIRAMGEFLGITYQTAHRWANNPEKIRAEEIVKISKHTGIDECEIVDAIKQQINGDNHESNQG